MLEDVCLLLPFKKVHYWKLVTCVYLWLVFFKYDQVVFISYLVMKIWNTAPWFLTYLFCVAIETIHNPENNACQKGTVCEMSCWKRNPGWNDKNSIIYRMNNLLLLKRTWFKARLGLFCFLLQSWHLSWFQQFQTCNTKPPICTSYITPQDYKYTSLQLEFFLGHKVKQNSHADRYIDETENKQVFPGWPSSRISMSSSCTCCQNRNIFTCIICS